MVGFNIFVVGLILGSFANMLIYRLPHGVSLFRPARSVCPQCKATIPWYENIPLVSYIYLKGICSSCDTKISTSYFFVELLSGILAVLLWHKLGSSFEFVLVLLLFELLLILSVIDIYHLAVPDYMLILAVVVAFVLPEFDYIAALSFAGGGFLLELFVTYYIQNIKAKLTKNKQLQTARAMGEGDIPIFAIIGGVLGSTLGLVAITVGAFVALVPSVIATIYGKKPQIPFIPYLVVGLFVVYVGVDIL